jgi:hypothetical protein
MKTVLLGAGLATALALVMHGAAAQPISGCPAGQAIQSTDHSGHNVTCVAIPNVGALQGAISAETAARTAADAQLQSNIDAEAAARAGMDATLLQAIEEVKAGAGDNSIVGTYTFSGTQTCLVSSTGFNADLTPVAAPVGTSAVISQFSSVSTGTRTFNADGTGTATFFSHTLSGPGAFYFTQAPGVVSSGVTSGGPGRPGGNASASEQTGSFTWEVVDGKLIIEDAVGAVGTITRGPSAGCTVANTNTPRAIGVLGKDLRIITITHENVQVEVGTTTCPNGSVSSNQRVCNRERTLRKM